MADVLANGSSGAVIVTTTVVGLQGRPVDSTAPTVNQALVWSGSAWRPATPAVSITVPNAPLLSGDGSSLGSITLGANLSLAGTFPNQTLNATSGGTGGGIPGGIVNQIQTNAGSGNFGGVTMSGDATWAIPSGTITVTKIQGQTISATAPTTGQVLGWSGTAWTPATPPITVANGVVGQVPVYTATNTITGSPNITYISNVLKLDTSGRTVPAFAATTPPFQVATPLGTGTRISTLSYGAGPVGGFMAIAVGDGAGANAPVGLNTSLGTFCATGFDGTNIPTQTGALTFFSTESGAWNPNAHGTRLVVRTTPTGSGAIANVAAFGQDGSLVMNPDTLVSQGAYTINCAGLFVNNNPIGTGGITGTVANNQIVVGTSGSSVGAFPGGSAGTVLHGAGASTLPTWGAVNLASEVTGLLPVSGINATGTPSATTYLSGIGVWSTPAGSGSGVVNSGSINQTAYYASAGIGVSGSNAILMSGTSVTAMNMNIATANTGDMYYRAAGGALTPILIGSGTQVLGISGGVPAWVNNPQGTVTGSGLTANAVIVGGGGTSINALGTVGATNTVLHGNTGAAPTWSAVNVAMPGGDITGILAVANGGTGSSTAIISGMTAGQIPIAASATTITSSGNLTGDVITSGSLATSIANNAVITAKINNGAVTYPKIQSSIGTQVLLGTGQTGNAWQEIVLGTGLSYTGTTLNVTSGGGNVSTSGSPANTYVAIFSPDATHITGTNNFTLASNVLKFDLSSARTIPAFAGASPQYQVATAVGTGTRIGTVTFGASGPAGGFQAIAVGDATGSNVGVGNNNALGIFCATGYDGTSIPAQTGALLFSSTEAFSSINNHGTKLDIRTTPTGAGAIATVATFDQNGSLYMYSPAGTALASMGQGTINAAGYYVSGVALGFAESVGWLAGANPHRAIIFINQTGRSVTVNTIYCQVEVANGSNPTMHVYKTSSPTGAITSGTQVSTTAPTCNAVNLYNMGVSGTAGVSTLAPGDRLGINVTTATPTFDTMVATISVYMV